jgi:hypothetical protein
VFSIRPLRGKASTSRQSLPQDQGSNELRQVVKELSDRVMELEKWKAEKTAEDENLRLSRRVASLELQVNRLKKQI